MRDLPTSRPRKPECPSTRGRINLPAGEDGTGRVVALTFSFAFPDLFYCRFPRGRWTYARRLQVSDPHTCRCSAAASQLLEIKARHARGTQPAPWVITVAWRSTAQWHGSRHMLTHEATDQTCTPRPGAGASCPRAPREALNSVTNDPAYFSR